MCARACLCTPICSTATSPFGHAFRSRAAAPPAAPCRAARHGSSPAALLAPAGSHAETPAQAPHVHTQCPVTCDVMPTRLKHLPTCPYGTWPRHQRIARTALPGRQQRHRYQHEHRHRGKENSEQRQWKRRQQPTLTSVCSICCCASIFACSNSVVACARCAEMSSW